MKNTNLTGRVVFDSQQGMVPPRLASAPIGEEGATYYDTTLQALRVYTNGTWGNVNTKANTNLEYTISGLATMAPIQFNSALSITKTQRTQHLYYEISDSVGEVRTGFIMMSFATSGQISFSDEDTSTNQTFDGFKFSANVDLVDSNLCNLYYEIENNIDTNLLIKFIVVRF